MESFTPSYKFRYINGHRWYYRLKKNTGSKGSAVFDYLTREQAREKLLVQMTDQKGARLFTWFNDYLKFNEYQLKFDVEARCFYETILGEYAQKPHFDIDLNIKKNPGVDINRVRNELIKAIVLVLGELDIMIDPERNIIICTSHGKFKKSIHVVLDGYCHMNNLEAKAFYKKVVAKMTIYSEFVDRAVYSSLQQFRMLGSRKLGSERPKIFHKKWNFGEQTIEYKYNEKIDSVEHEAIVQLGNSLVTNVGYCDILPNLIEEEERTYELTDVSEEQFNQAWDLFRKIHTGIIPFKIRNTVSNTIVLKRIKPSGCPICNRVHQNENPFLFIIEKSVYFHCRRAPMNKKLLIGSIEDEVSTSSSDIENKPSESLTNPDGTPNLKAIDKALEGLVRESKRKPKFKKQKVTKPSQQLKNWDETEKIVANLDFL